MKEIVMLRDKPKLKISLNEVGIEITDAAQSKKCEFFLFNDILGIDIKPKKADWVITSLAWIFGLLITAGDGNIYKNEAYLELKMANQNLKIWLDNANFEKAEHIFKLINVKIST